MRHNMLREEISTRENGRKKVAHFCYKRAKNKRNRRRKKTRKKSSFCVCWRKNTYQHVVCELQIIAYGKVILRCCILVIFVALVAAGTWIKNCPKSLAKQLRNASNYQQQIHGLPCNALLRLLFRLQRDSGFWT